MNKYMNNAIQIEIHIYKQDDTKKLNYTKINKKKQRVKETKKHPIKILKRYSH